MDLKIIRIGIFIVVGAIGSVYGQKLVGKSNVIQYKGAAVLADEKRQEEERRRLAEEERQLQERRTAELESVTIEELGISRDQLPRYYALIMGVSNYAHTGPGLPNLTHPVEDAAELQNILVNQFTFAPENVKLLVNPERKDVIQQLEYLSETVTERDNVLIFYAGHGYYDKTKEFGYWLATDADVDDRSTWIRNSDVKDYLGAIKSKHTLLIADACFSGSIFKSRNVDAPSVVLAKFVETYRDKSRRAMTSGSLTTVPDKSVFIHFLLKELQDNRDVFLTSSTLFVRMYEPITNNAITRPLFGVIQGVGDEGGDFIFIKRN